jgi:transcription factor SPN1
MSIPDPRVQRVKRSDSFSVAPVPPPKDNPPSSSIGVKRAPSYGALAQGPKQDHTATYRGPIHVRNPSGSYPSSDEEEKVRTTRAKKMKTKVDSVVPTTLRTSSPPTSSTPSCSGSDTVPSTPAAKASTLPAKDRVSPKAKSTKVIAGREEESKTPKSPTPTNRPSNKIDAGKTRENKKSRPLAMNLQRNPSMLGPELPHLHSTTKYVSATPAYGGTVTPTKIRSPSPAVLAAPPPVVGTIPVLDVHQSPTPSKVKTLRRVRRLPPARRISFGSLVPGDEADADGEGEAGEGSPGLSGCLGSAFQLKDGSRKT